jgi:hypothetical protein
MAILGRQDILSKEDREMLYELAGVRAFAGALDRSLYIKYRPTEPEVGAANRLVEMAGVQQRLNDAGARHWAAIELIGSTLDHVYVVERHYPVSAATLTASPKRISGKGLYNIVNSVVAGLAELRALAGRPHGNLKASNVLLAGEVEDGAVVLSDPAPADGHGTAGADAEALGQLIHQLVLHRPFTGPWPIARTGEWLALGPQGAEWLKLCAALMHPNAGRRLTNLAKISAAVRRLRPRAMIWSRLLPMAAAAVLGGGRMGCSRWFMRGRRESRLCQRSAFRGLRPGKAWKEKWRHGFHRRRRLPSRRLPWCRVPLCRRLRQRL